MGEAAAALVEQVSRSSAPAARRRRSRRSRRSSNASAIRTISPRVIRWRALRRRAFALEDLGRDDEAIAAFGAFAARYADAPETQ